MKYDVIPHKQLKKTLVRTNTRHFDQTARKKMDQDFDFQKSGEEALTTTLGGPGDSISGLFGQSFSYGLDRNGTGCELIDGIDEFQ